MDPKRPTETNKPRNNGYRVFFYVAGLVVLAAGLMLTTRSDMGSAPLISIPLAVSMIFGGKFGDHVLVLYIAFAVIEYIIKWSKFKPYDLLQIPLSIVFTRIINLFAAYLPTAENVTMQVLYLVIGVILTGIGASMSVNARIIPNPADGLVQALSDRSGKSMGFCKNATDISCVVIACIIGLVFKGSLIGIGVGTVIAMLFIGRVVWLYNKLFYEKTARLSGLL